jgi:hypothetical protein
MVGDARTLRKTLLAAMLALLVLVTSACQSTAKAAGAQQVDPAQVHNVAPTTSRPASDTQICGTPPCMRFVSRSETKTVADTVSAHPILSAVVLHGVGLLLCGGILCVFGEGVSLAYVGREAGIAAKAHECLRVRILPSGQEWRLVDISPSNQSPYCTD